MINFILEYWIFAALIVAVWAFFKFATYNYRRNVARVKGNNNILVQVGAPPIRRTPKQTEEDIQKILEKLMNQ